MSYICNYLKDIKKITDKININSLEKLINLISILQKKRRRFFFLRNSGSASNSSPIVNNFKKILNIFQENQIESQIIIVIEDLIKKFSSISYNFFKYSSNNVEIFSFDLIKLKFKI
jgi:hypothetical protein